MSQEIKINVNDIAEDDIKIIRSCSRKIWAYFEDFAEESNNWLAPDNFQEDPPNGVATRTSPTNMGMGLTAALAAYDLGYISMSEAVDRIEKTVTSMEGLQRYKGHFYNWYDTISKTPLYPKYISTVDSGNLVGYLWLSAEALEEFKRSIIINITQIQGIDDALILSNEEVEGLTDIKDLHSSEFKEAEKRKFNGQVLMKILKNLDSRVMEIQRLQKGRTMYWNMKAKRSISSCRREIEELFPWLNLIIEDSAEIQSVSDKLGNLTTEVPLDEMEERLEKVKEDLTRSYQIGRLNDSQKDIFNKLIAQLEISKKKVREFLTKIDLLIARINKVADETDFKMLYDKEREIFSIGYDAENDTLGNSFYDLMASESRQASFIAIAKGDVEQKHWFNLGRAMTKIGRMKGLISWSGTMFEYLMPLLIQRCYPGTLLEETYKGIIYGQKRYCKSRKVPWGISESAFYTFDAALNYQYKAFGVPGLGLKRGLAAELVISPYSTIMALQVDRKSALENIRKLMDEGFEGRYGFYES
ncbi:MAG: glucoamylase family protein, partial [Clostridiaceae bacterium]